MSAHLTTGMRAQLLASALAAGASCGPGQIWTPPDRHVEIAREMPAEKCAPGFMIFPQFRCGKPPIPFVDGAHLRGAFDFTQLSEIYKDSAHTTRAALNDYVHSVAGVTGAGAAVYLTNVGADATAFIARNGYIDGASGVLQSTIAQTNPYTCYALCERGTSAYYLLSDISAPANVNVNPYVSSLYAKQGTTQLSLAGDDSTKRIRGVAFNGTSSVIFIGSSESGALNMGSAGWTPELRIGDGKLYRLWLYDGYHDATARAAVRAQMAAL